MDWLSFNLAEGDYTIEINGYIFNFSVPETTYLDANICSEVTFHVGDEQGYPLDNVLIDIDGSYLITDFNGEADTCLQVGNYSYSASKLGYINQTGTFEMDTIPQTVEIVMTLTTWAVTLIARQIVQIISMAGNARSTEKFLTQVRPHYLTNGSWDTYISWLGCWGELMGQIIVNNAPVNIGFLPVDNPKATFHVQRPDR